MIVPITRLTSAAAKAKPNEIFRALSVRRLVMMAQNWSGESSNVLKKSPASGIKMMTDSQVSVSPMVRPKPGRLLRRAALPFTKPCLNQPISILVDLVENATFAEMFLLRLGPAAEHVVDREQLDLRKGFLIFLGDLGIVRTIGIACGNFLTFLCIPVFQIGLGRGTRALFIGNGIDDGDRGLSQDRERRRD